MARRCDIIPFERAARPYPVSFHRAFHATLWIAFAARKTPMPARANKWPLRERWE
jgi:hypothetical protein